MTPLTTELRCTTDLLLPATFFFRELAIRINGINEGSLVPLHLDKSRHFWESVSGEKLQSGKIGAFVSLFSFPLSLEGILFLMLSSNDQIAHYL